MTPLEIYTIIMDHSDLILLKSSESLYCNENCNNCPLSGNIAPFIYYCSRPRIKQIFENLPTLKFQYKASK